MRIGWSLAVFGLMSLCGVFVGQVYGVSPVDQAEKSDHIAAHFVNRAKKAERLNPKIVPILSVGSAALKYENKAVLSVYRPSKKLLTKSMKTSRQYDGVAHHRAPSLGSFFQQLSRLKNHTRTDPVRILHIGGRSLSSDQFANRMRKRFGVEFPNAGAGNLLLDFKNDKAYRVGIRYKTKGKVSSASLSNNDVGAFGLNGIRLQLLEVGSEFNIGFEKEAYEWVEFTALSGPRQGVLTFEIGGLRQEVSLLEDDEKIKRIRVDVSGKNIIFGSLKGRVELLSVRAGYKRAGVQYETIALTPKSKDLFYTADRDYVKEDLQHIRPDLIIVSLGDDAHSKERDDLKVLKARWDWILKKIKRHGEDAPIIILGPHDRANHLPQNHKPLGQESVRCHRPIALENKRMIARKLALTYQASFWDWSTAMGGHCAIQTWRSAVPPLVEPDLQTLTSNGEQYSAQLFAWWLLTQKDNRVAIQ